MEQLWTGIERDARGMSDHRPDVVSNPVSSDTVLSDGAVETQSIITNDNAAMSVADDDNDSDRPSKRARLEDVVPSVALPPSTTLSATADTNAGTSISNQQSLTVPSLSESLVQSPTSSVSSLSSMSSLDNSLPSHFTQSQSLDASTNGRSMSQSLMETTQQPPGASTPAVTLSIDTTPFTPRTLVPVESPVAATSNTHTGVTAVTSTVSHSSSASMVDHMTPTIAPIAQQQKPITSPALTLPPILPPINRPAALPSPLPRLSDRLSFDPAVLDSRMLLGARQSALQPLPYQRHPQLTDAEDTVCRSVHHLYGFNIGSIIASGQYSVRESVELMCAWHEVERIQSQFPYRPPRSQSQSQSQPLSPSAQPQSQPMAAKTKPKKIIVKRKMDAIKKPAVTAVHDSDSESEGDDLVILKMEGVNDTQSRSRSRSASTQSSPASSHLSKVHRERERLLSTSKSPKSIDIELVDSTALSYKAGVALPYRPNATKRRSSSKSNLANSDDRCGHRWVDEFGFTQRCEWVGETAAEMEAHKCGVHHRRGLPYACSHCQAQIADSQEFKLHLEECHPEQENSLTRRGEKTGYMIELEPDKKGERATRTRASAGPAVEKPSSKSIHRSQKRMRRALVDDSNSDGEEEYDDGSSIDSDNESDDDAKHKPARVGYSRYNDRLCNFQFKVTGKDSDGNTQEIAAVCEFAGQPAEVKQHQSAHQSKLQRKFTCSHCDFGHRRQAAIQSHIEQCHKKLEKELRSRGMKQGKVVEHKVADEAPAKSTVSSPVAKAVPAKQRSAGISGSNKSTGTSEKFRSSHLASQSAPPPFASAKPVPSTYRCPITFTVNNREYQCEFSSRAQDNKWEKHKALHSQDIDYNYRCSHCRAQSNWYNILRLHIQLHHSKLDAELTARGEPVGRILPNNHYGKNQGDSDSEDVEMTGEDDELLTSEYQGKVEGESEGEGETTITHTNNVASTHTARFECPVKFIPPGQSSEWQCEYIGTTELAINTHVLQHYDNDSADKRYQCSLCQLRLSTSNAVNEHVLLCHRWLNIERVKSSLRPGRSIDLHASSHAAQSVLNLWRTLSGSMVRVNKAAEQRQGEEDHEPIPLTQSH